MNAGHLVEAGPVRLLMDCGGGVVHRLATLGLDWAGVTHVALTHFDQDHTSDVAALFLAWRYGQLPPRAEPVTVLGPPGTRALMERVGQVPVVAMKETRGFVLNRMQAALVAEAFRLVRDGVMSAEDVDACVRDGLGLRWSFMGPFETIDLNAPGGVADYAARFGPLMGGITEEQTPFLYDADTVAKVDATRRARLAREEIGERSAWRDRRLMALAAHKKAQAN